MRGWKDDVAEDNLMHECEEQSSNPQRPLKARVIPALWRQTQDRSGKLARETSPNW